MTGLDFAQDMYAQQGKSDFNGNIDNINHNPQADFPRQQYQFHDQPSGLYNGNVPQYNEPQLLPQHIHQSSAQHQQRFDSVPQSYSPAPQGYVQSPQQHQARPERVFSQSPHPYQAQQAQQVQQAGQHQQNNQQFSDPTPPFQPNQAPVYQQHKLMPQQVPQQVPYAQPAFQTARHNQGVEQPRPAQPQPQSVPQVKPMPAQVRTIQQPQPQSEQPQQQPQQQSQQQPQEHLQQNLQQHQHLPQYTQVQPPQLQAHAAAPSSQASTPTIDNEPAPTKKRKRVIKKEQEPEQADSPIDSTLRRVESVENLPLPTSTEEEIAVTTQFRKRNAAAKKQFPSIPGASYLVSLGTVKVPAPKSYDRLAPVVALPSISGKKILPELSHDLPCEIQGRFTDKYRPSAHFSGRLQDRELEAKPYIDQYQREMRLLGARRPKYTDYPFTLQEQFKADEAAKSKAQRRAKKEEEEERKKPIRSETRPSDPVEGAVWDILGIVYIDPSATRTSNLIANAVQGLGDYLTKLRTEITRTKQEIDQAEKDRKPASVIAEWTRKQELKRETFARVCEAATKFGDEAVLENLGSHQKAILCLVNMLIGCIKTGDLSGSFPKAILRFMSNISIVKKVSEAVNFENVRKRLADKGDDEVKDLIRTVALRIKKESDSGNGVDMKKTPSATGVAKAAKPVKPVDGSPAKRPREDDSDARTHKKVAIETANNKLVAKPGSGSLQSKLGASKPRLAPSATLAGKIRPPKPVVKEAAKPTVPKPEASSSSTPMDVDKKLLTAASKPEQKVPAAKPAVASGSSLSSIASLLDSINTPKSDGQTTQAKDSNRDALETPEAKAKRLRKEARRKLRVTWKPESDLVQVRIFHKEAAEDEDNMTRDAADDRSEGMMLKQRGNYNEEDDDDDDLPEKPWVAPILADLSRIAKDYRAKSFVTRGGSRTFNTDEQKAMEEREKKELMVIYTDASDIPPTPKSPALEPTVPESDGKIAKLPQGDAKFEEIHKRWKDAQQFGWEAAAYYAGKRLDARDDPAAKLNSLLGNLNPVAPAVTPEPYNMTPPGEPPAQPIVPVAAEMQAVPVIPFDDEVYRILTSDKTKNLKGANPAALPTTHRRHDYPDPVVQAAADKVEDVAEQLKGLPYPASNPPAWLLNDAERVREWWAGYQKDSIARAKKDAEDRARAEAEASKQQAAPKAQDNQDAWAAYYQQQQYAQYVALVQQMQGGQAPQPAQPAPAPIPPAPTPSVDNAQLQALLAQMASQQQAGPGAPQGGGFGLNPQDAGYQQLLMLAQMQQQQQQHQQPQQQAPVPESPTEHKTENKPNYGRKLIDYSDRDSRDDFEQPHRGRDRDRERDRDGGRGGKQGKNRKGNAPGGATLPPHRPVNRALIGTKPCSFWQQGKCARGDKCTFRHDN
ncbi:hypothetical protein CTRI78_v009290 [Colletotrichum trifolii]|uniref:C3H1-type domain-containing protein n=1 Tax=Colletotrichum trifolii TaxID=5466 RepID=A0A4R8QWZ0_COLTR|nr:hypothetical protein CTRI78_v009290 [Colletotrichum trifolii]